MKRAILTLSKKLLTAMLIVDIFVIFFLNSFVLADSSSSSFGSLEEAREYLADYAYNFCMNHGSECFYNYEPGIYGYERANEICNRETKITCNGGPEPSAQYLSENGYPSGYKYRFDCTGFVGCMINWAFGFGGSYFPVDVYGHTSDGRFQSMSLSASSFQKGDILYTADEDHPHVAIYVGNGNMVDMVHGGVKYRSYTALAGYNWVGVARLNTLNGVTKGGMGGGTEIEPTPSPDPTPTPTPEPMPNEGPTIPDPSLDYTLDGLIDLDNPSQQFEFNGMPNTVTNTGGHSLMYYLNKIGEAFDYLFGVILNGFKVVPVGIIVGLENWITNVFNGLNNVTDSSKIYTIEDLVFNKISPLDPNVFSDNAGGKPVIADSAIDKVRNAIANWYVSIRNIAMIALFIIIVYIGVRMAIATSASAKANYKGMLIHWIVALLIVCAIHFIMIIVLNINDNLVTLLSEGVASEEEMYETIRTRTWDLRISVGFPAAVIYIVLFIMYIKFIWVYIKRLFTVLILIAIAPFIGVKYAMESAKTGKKSKAFADWLYDFSMNVFLQAMHALIYASIMSIAIDLSTKSVIGYIIALVFINFILKADKIFMNIFNFRKSKTAADTSEPMKEPKKQFAAAVQTVGSAVVVAEAAGGLVSWAGSKAKIIGREAYRAGAKAWDKKYGGDVRKRNKARIDSLHDKYDNAMNTVHRALTGEDSNVRVLSVMSRQKGSLGRAAKKQLKKAKASRKKKYSAPFKFVRSATGNALKIAFGIPAMVVNPSVGVSMISNGIAGNFKMSTAKDDKGNKYKGAEGAAQFFTMGVYGTQKEINKSEQKVDKAVMYIKDIANKEENIRKSFKDTFGDNETKTAKEYKKDISYILTYAEKDNIHMLLRERLNARDILKIDDNNLDRTVDSMVDDISKQIGLEDQYTEAKVKEIRKKMAEKAKEIYNDTKAYNASLANSPQPSTSSTQATVSNEPKMFGAENMAKGFAEAIMEEGIRVNSKKVDTVEKYKKLTKEIMDLHDTNKKAQKDLKTSVLRETEFIKTLNRKKGSTDSENRFI